MQQLFFGQRSAVIGAEESLPNDPVDYEEDTERGDCHLRPIGYPSPGLEENGRHDEGETDDLWETGRIDKAHAR
jgi:hypothetical protein